MNKIYADASHDTEYGIGSYCIVIVSHGKKPDWFVEECDQKNSTATEKVALVEAIDIAHKLSLSNHYQSEVLSDCLAVIKKLRPEATKKGIVLTHIAAHTVDNTATAPLSDDIKRQHWCDVMARALLRERIAGLTKTRA